jgi:hypothetical protein
MYGEQDWRRKLNAGDKVVFEISHYFLEYPTYFEDKVKEIIINKDKDIVKTEAGLTFINGGCYRNGFPLGIENPNDDYFGDGKNRRYQEYKFKLNSNISQYQSKLSLTLNHIWNDLEKGMPQHVYNQDWQNAIIEDKYRDKDKINYFKTLSKCIGFGVKNNSLYKNNELFIERCSKSIGKYKIFRQPLKGEEKKITKWQKSLIYIWNSESNEIRQELNMSFYYAWYWTEREVESYDNKYKRKYDNVHHGNNFIHILKILNKE